MALTTEFCLIHRHCRGQSYQACIRFDLYMPSYTTGGLRKIRLHLYRGCWTYSHHCQIADKNPSKRWNGEFRWFRICIGFVQRDFVLWVFVCSVSFSLSFPATTPRATTPHQYAQGYHALTTTARLSRLCIYPGYHAIV